MLFYAQSHTPLGLDPSSSLLLHRMDGGNIIHHVISPPSQFLLVAPGVLGKPICRRRQPRQQRPQQQRDRRRLLRAATIDVSASVAKVSAVVAGMSAFSVDVSAAAVDLCPFDTDVRATIPGVSAAVVNVSAAIVNVSAVAVNVSASVANVSAAVADVSAAVVDLSPYFINTSTVAADVSADVNVANINIVPAALNHGTLPFDNIMSTSRCESTGRSVKPSNVTGLDNQHKMWIRQGMIDDWGIRFPHKFQICVTHHVAFHCNQIVYIIAKPGSGKLAIPLLIG